MVTEHSRVESYRNAPDEIRMLYVSDTLTNHVDKLYTLFKVTAPFRTMSEIVGDTILGFYKISDMPRLFQQKLNVSADDSQRMTSQLIEFLSPVVKREEMEANARKEEVSNLAQSFAQPNPDRLKDPEIQAYTENVEPIRTMSEDMNRVHGYGAYRAQEENEGDDDSVADTDKAS